MKITNEVMAKLQESVERMAKRDGQAITGYITERTTMYMEKGYPPTLSPNDSILYQYTSGDNVKFLEKIRNEKKEVAPDTEPSIDKVVEKAVSKSVEEPKMAWTVAEIRKYLESHNIPFEKFETKKVLLQKIEDTKQDNA